MRALHSISAGIAKAEITVACVFGLLIALFILLNVVTRTMGTSIFWVDEAAIASMVWMAFLGASASIHYRSSVAVTLIPDALPTRAAVLAGKLVDVLVLVFFAVLLVLTFHWFDPLTLARLGFAKDAFSGRTFNFIYAETTTTLGFPKFWLWLIMPIFAVGSAIHALSNLLSATVEASPEDFGLTEID
ncbi:TRAP transporter small permease [Amorphus sp. MBR-141]